MIPRIDLLHYIEFVRRKPHEVAAFPAAALHVLSEVEGREEVVAEAPSLSELLVVLVVICCHRLAADVEAGTCRSVRHGRVAGVGCCRPPVLALLAARAFLGAK